MDAFLVNKNLSRYNHSNKRKQVFTMRRRILNSILLFGLVLLILIVALTKRESEQKKNIKQFTVFYDVQGDEIDEDNEIKKKIAEITGAECEEIWLGSQTKDDAINSYIASGEYTDFIVGGLELYQVGALLPIDMYWDDYPNIKQYMSEEEWNRLRLDDGHIYWIPQFGIVNGEDIETIHEGEAFWIQTRVLKWAGYPDVRTLDEYFELIGDYYEANPMLDNQIPNIPYTILCDDWRYFCLENPPQFLDGYPNDGSCMVDPVNLKVLDYNFTDTEKKYFKTLNEQYKKGIVDPESFTSTYEEYIEKLSTGAVLGMVDQWWQFSYNITSPFEKQNLDELGCNYVPLPITIDRSIKNQWHVKRSNELDTSSGISVTISCQDVEGAFQFINDLLGEEVQNLRYWGIKDVDYHVDENGVFYRTDEQREKRNLSDYLASHFCSYAYFPRREGINEDGINMFSPEYQLGEFQASLPIDVKECFEAYGAKTYVDMIGTNEQPGVWYPMYSYSTLLTNQIPAGVVWKEMTEVKQQWLPQVVMADNFDAAWAQYKNAYDETNPDVFFDDMQLELERRIKQAE